MPVCVYVVSQRKSQSNVSIDSSAHLVQFLAELLDVLHPLLHVLIQLSDRQQRCVSNRRWKDTHADGVNGSIASIKTCTRRKVQSRIEKKQSVVAQALNAD
eukprot:3573171-Rhodomonas_salina.3